MKKSKVSRSNNQDMKFIGYCFFKDYQNRLYKAKPHQKSVENFKYKLKQLNRKNWSVDTKYLVERINQLIRGWINYLKVAHMKVLLRKIVSHTRVRLTMCIWKKWKTARNGRKNLIKKDIDKYKSYKNNNQTKVEIRIAYYSLLTTKMTKNR